MFSLTDPLSFITYHTDQVDEFRIDCRKVVPTKIGNGELAKDVVED
jgi:hypothetical protein